MLEIERALVPDGRAINVKFSYADFWLGGFRLVFADTDSVGIWNIEIDQNYRGIGLGTQMMKEAVEFIKENYPGRFVFLWVHRKNAPAIKVYENCGFFFSPQFLYRDSMTVRMELPR